MDEKDRSEKWKSINQLIAQFRELNRRMAVDAREIAEIRLQLHELSDSETLDEISRKLRLMSDPEVPTVGNEQ